MTLDWKQSSALEVGFPINSKEIDKRLKLNNEEIKMNKTQLNKLIESKIDKATWPELSPSQFRKKVMLATDLRTGKHHLGIKFIKPTEVVQASSSFPKNEPYKIVTLPASDEEFDVVNSDKRSSSLSKDEEDFYLDKLYPNDKSFTILIGNKKDAGTARQRHYYLPLNTLVLNSVITYDTLDDTKVAYNTFTEKLNKAEEDLVKRIANSWKSKTVQQITDELYGLGWSQVLSDWLDEQPEYANNLVDIDSKLNDKLSSIDEKALEVLGIADDVNDNF